MKKEYIAVLLCAVLFCGLMGCASTEAPQNSANGSASLLQEATNWFESQTSKYEILSAEAINDSAIFLTGTKNPGTDEYHALQYAADCKGAHRTSGIFMCGRRGRQCRAHRRQ